MLFKVLRQQRKLHIFTVRVMSCLTTKIIVKKNNIFLNALLDLIIMEIKALKLHTLYLRTIGERSDGVGGGEIFLSPP